MVIKKMSHASTNNGNSSCVGETFELAVRSRSMSVAWQTKRNNWNYRKQSASVHPFRSSFSSMTFFSETPRNTAIL